MLGRWNDEGISIVARRYLDHAPVAIGSSIPVV